MRWVESAVPPVGEVEDRYVEHKHWVVHSPVAPEYSSPFVRETSLSNFHSFFLLPRRSLTIHFLSRVHSFPFVVSLVEQEKGKKADQNPEQRAENGEPEWDVPARVGDGIRFCLSHPLGFLVSCWPLVATPKRAACPD
jgi:hypothetical protein